LLHRSVDVTYLNQDIYGMSICAEQAAFSMHAFYNLKACLLLGSRKPLFLNVNKASIGTLPYPNRTPMG
jgi:hypothetical protein